jgi:hypothetical protein
MGVPCARPDGPLLAPGATNLFHIIVAMAWWIRGLAGPLDGEAVQLNIDPVYMKCLPLAAALQTARSGARLFGIMP